MKFKIGDLVKPARDYQKKQKHTARQCKVGIIISFDKHAKDLLYKIYWWPYNNYFYFLAESLELVSRVPISDRFFIKNLHSSSKD